MRYLYSGEFSFREGDEDNIETIIDILRVADEEFLDDVSSFGKPADFAVLYSTCY